MSFLVANFIRTRVAKYMTNNIKQESSDFNGLGIAPKLFEILKDLNFTIPTPIQHQSIPITIKGKDMVGIAQTGTGKTLAFGIPMIQRLAQHKGRGLVILPTRELAFQVEEHLSLLGQKLGLRIAVLVGGEPMGRQLKRLQANPHIIVATPGRLIDHINRRSVRLNDVKILVLDEADLMFDMGFAPQIKEVLKSVPKERQTMLFSATMAPNVMQLAAQYMAMPIRVEVAPAGTVAEKVEHEMIIINREGKINQLEKILLEYSGSVLIFVRTKHGVKNLNKKIQNMGHASAEIHSNRSLGQRREALAGFKSGKIRILVATDIAARGIDVKGIELVLNYDLPDKLEDYVHRIGRTGRAGKAGKAVSFAQPDQIGEIRKIEQIIKESIPMTQLDKINTSASYSSHSRQRRNNFSAPYSARAGGRGFHNRGAGEKSFHGSKFKSARHENMSPFSDKKREDSGAKTFDYNRFKKTSGKFGRGARSEQFSRSDERPRNFRKFKKRNNY